MGKQKSKENELALDGDGAAGVRALDIGFRVFKVSDSNMEDVFYLPNEVTQAMLPGMVNNVKEGRTGLDLLISTRLEWFRQQPFQAEAAKAVCDIIFNSAKLIKGEVAAAIIEHIIYDKIDDSLLHGRRFGSELALGREQFGRKWYNYPCSG